MINDGLTIGLQLWLMSLIIFFFLGYSWLSIGLGAIAAIAGRFITMCLKATTQAPPVVNTDKKESALKQARNRLTSWGERKNSKRLPSGPSSKKGSGRKRRRSLSSRR